MRFSRFPKGRRRHTPGKMNRLEQRHALRLTSRKQLGEIIDFWFERVKQRAAQERDDAIRAAHARYDARVEAVEWLGAVIGGAP